MLSSRVPRAPVLTLLCYDRPPAHSEPPVLAPRLTTPNALVFLTRFVKAACLPRRAAAPRSQTELQAPSVDTYSS